MPTYEYECKQCSHNFEVFQAISDDPLKICPKCGKELRRLIYGGAGVIFKGSGFYVTDKDSGKTGDKGSGAKAKPEKQPADTACPAATGNAGSKGNDSPCSGCPKNTAGPAEKSA